MSIIRVFPRRTSHTPDDDMAFVGDPPLFRPEADEVHISVTFTWDIPEGERLREAWARYYPVVKIGGPAMGSKPDGFTPGLYLKGGITFTSRGCNNHCPFCLVPEREGKLRELPIVPGYVIQDNNILQCSREHVEQVFAMLREQRHAAVFSGGIQASLVGDWFADGLRTIRIASLFLAADTDSAIEPLRQALEHIGFLGRRKLRCYVLIGREDMADAERRLEKVWELGAMPFAQLYQPADGWISYSRDWRLLQKKWTRPAAMVASHGGTKAAYAEVP